MTRAERMAVDAVARMAAELPAKGVPAAAICGAAMGWALGAGLRRSDDVAELVLELRSAADAIEVTAARLSCRGQA